MLIASEPSTIDGLVRRAASLAPSSPAVVEGDAAVSYADLDRAVAAAVAALTRAGLRAGDRAGVCAERSTALVVALLAIARAGAAYVPLDPALPDDRLATMLATVPVALVVASDARRDRFGTVPIVALAALAGAPAAAAADEGPSLASPDGTAYVIFTSGSTGRPKAIAVPHRALANLGVATRDALGVVSSDRWLFRAAIGFDASLSELAVAFAAGAAVVVAPDAISGDPRALVALAAERGVTALGAVPSLVRAILDEERLADVPLRLLTCGGEPLGAALVRRCFERCDATLVNLYGPSEATGHVTIHRCVAVDAHASSSVPLGSPIANATVTVRDPALAPVAPGVAGEIVIGGLPLADGYVGLPAETALRFPADPAAGGARCYRTGDLGIVEGGELRYLGRADGQVKVRGVRIEPGDVARALERVAGIAEAHVVARPRAEGGDPADLALVAYVRAEVGEPLDDVAVRRSLGELLPRAMLPAAIRAVAAFPVTASGKVDLAALRARPLDAAAGAGRAAAEPRDDLERRLAAMWSALLGPIAIGRDDAFYDAGGDSLLGATLLRLVERDFGRRVSFAAFFEEPTIAGLARLVDGDRPAGPRDVVRVRPEGAGTPFVLFHGDFAGGLYARRLAALLGPERPVTLVAPHGAERTPVPRTFERMAADFAARIDALHPRGPLLLGGYSASAAIAAEVARLLRRRGRRIDDLILIAEAPRNGSFRPLRRIAAALGVAPAVFGNAAALLGRRHAPPESRGHEIEDGPEFRHYARAHERFIPHRDAGSALLVWPRGQIDRTGDASAAWRALVGDVVRVEVPGDHFSALTQHLDRVAAAIAARFAERGE